MENREIADRLDAFAALLELAEANPYTARAYRRAADTIRSTPLRGRRAGPQAPHTRAARDRERIEARLRELIETGEIAEVTELERELSGADRARPLSRPDRQALARARARARDHHRGRVPRRGQGRAAADRAGVGPKIEARITDALAREPDERPSRGLLLNQARELVGGVAAALGGEVAGDVRRWRDSCEHLAVVCAASDPGRRSSDSRRCRRSWRSSSRTSRRAVGRDGRGRAGLLVVAPPGASGRRCSGPPGRPHTWVRSSRCRRRPTRRPYTSGSGSRGARPSSASSRSAATPPELLELSEIRGDLHSHTTWSDGRASVEEMGRAAAERGYEYLAICDHTPAVGAVNGLTADEVRRQGEEIAAANEILAPFRILRGIECDILPDGRLDLPTTSCRSSTGCRRASTAASGCRAPR